MANSIGSLFVDISARTAQLEKDMGRVRGILSGIKDDTTALNNTTKGMDLTSAFTKGMVATMALRMAIRAVIKEVIDVLEHIETIPGVPPETIASVQQLRQSLHEVNVGFQDKVATILAGANNWWQSVKLQAQILAAQFHGGTGDNIGLPLVTQTPEEMDRAANPNYDKEMATARAEHTKLTRELAEATGDLASKMAELSKEEQIEAGIAAEGHNSPLAAMKDQNAVLTTQLALKKDMNTLDKELAAAQSAGAKAVSAGAEKEQPLYFQIRDLKSKLAELQAEINAHPQYTVAGVDANGVTQMRQNPQNIQTLVTLTKEQTQAQTQLNAAMKQYGDLANEVGNAIADDMVQGIEKGKSFKSIVDQIASSIIKLIIQQEVEKPLAAMFGSAASSIGGAIVGAFASGGPFVANQPFIAGENGPELVMPTTSGSVMNAGDTSRMGGGGSSDVNTHITNNYGGGVSREELAGMIPTMVMQAKAAVLDAVRRGGAYRQVFANGS